MLTIINVSSTKFYSIACLLLQVKFHENYPERSAEIKIIDSTNVDNVSAFEDDISKIVRKKSYT